MTHDAAPAYGLWFLVAWLVSACSSWRRWARELPTAPCRAMTEQMSRGELTTEQSKQMADRMGLMSNMMRQLSGLEAMPAITQADLQKEMDEMRQQMDEMKHDSPMMPGTK